MERPWCSHISSWSFCGFQVKHPFMAFDANKAPYSDERTEDESHSDLSGEFTLMSGMFKATKTQQTLMDPFELC